MAYLESPNGTISNTSDIIDSTGCPWSLVASSTSGLQVMIKGTIDTTTSNVTQLLYWNHGIYYQSAGAWYKRASGKWSPTTDPRVAPESASGTKLTSATGSIVDSTGVTWTLVASTASGLQAARNATVDTTTANIVLLLYWNHVVYQQNSAGGWWSWSGGWVGTTDPRVVVATGNVTINFASQTGNAVSKYLYGFSTGPLQDGDGGSFAIAANSTFIASAAKLRPTLIRFNITAGTVLNWNNGNTGVMNNFWNNYLRFCDPQVRLVMGVPGGNDTSVSPQTCANWAASFAQAMKNAGTEIMYWEVGNELDGLGPNTYASYFNPVADALHAVNPNYQVGGPVASWWNGIDLGTFASLAGSRCAFIDFHLYGASPGVTPSFNQAASDGTVSAARNQVQGTQLANLPIGVLEYNEVDVPDSSAAGQTQAQVYGAVWVALLLTKWVSEETPALSGALMAGLWDMVNDSNYGVIGNQFDGGGENYTSIDPQGWYLGYAGQNMAGNIVSASTTQSNLQVMATVSGGKFAIQLVNYGGSAQTLNITASGVTLPSSLTRWELSQANPNTTTSTIANLSAVVVPAQSIVIVTG